LGERAPNALVVGLGNALRRDDRCGLAVALRVRAHPRSDTSVLAWEGEPMALLDLWDGETDVVLVDATAPSGSPGTIRRFDAGLQSLPAQHFSLSSHAVGLGEAIETARALGRLPASLIVYGIEGADFDLGSELTPDVERSARVVAELLSVEIRGR
jgi:hydrogenase maturation protease